MAGKGLMILNTEPTTLSKYKIYIGSKTVHFDRLFLFSMVHVLISLNKFKLQFSIKSLSPQV